MAEHAVVTNAWNRIPVAFLFCLWSIDSDYYGWCDLSSIMVENKMEKKKRSFCISTVLCTKPFLLEGVEWRGKKWRNRRSSRRQRRKGSHKNRAKIPGCIVW